MKLKTNYILWAWLVSVIMHDHTWHFTPLLHVLQDTYTARLVTWVRTVWALRPWALLSAPRVWAPHPLPCWRQMSPPSHSHPQVPLLLHLYLIMPIRPLEGATPLESSMIIRIYIIIQVVWRMQMAFLPLCVLVSHP